MRVAIIGQGYVGLTIAVGAAGAGHSVIGFDVNPALVEQLNAGRSHIEGITDKDLGSFIAAGSYAASADASILDGSDVIVIAVPTPLDDQRNPDLSYVHAAAELIQKNVKSPALIVNESTSYPGTLRNEIAVKQSWIKNSAHLSAAAPWLLLLLLSTQPGTVNSYSTPTGALILAAGVGMTALAYTWMNFLGKLPRIPRVFCKQ